MGYSTEFTGRVTVAPPLNPAEVAFLDAFADTRRMARTSGPYFVEGTGDFGQGRDEDITDYNQPPAGQPSLWCDWVPTEDAAGIEWNGVEKFHDAEVWMQYLIDHFLKSGAVAQGLPGFEEFTFDHVVNGTIEAQGEIEDDTWQLVVTNNSVAKIEHETPF